MQVILPIAVILFLLRVGRGATDTLKKYERRGTMGDEENRLTSTYMRGL